MQADDIERLYQETTFGYDEPEAMYLTGRTLKDLAAHNGERLTDDSEGHPILDSQMYCLTAKGVFLVE